MPKTLIHDIDFSDGAHGDTVRSVFEASAPSGWSVLEYLDEGGSYAEVQQAIDVAIAQDCDLYIRSASAPWSYRDDFRRAWANGILPVNAHGSNADGAVLANPPRLFEAVIVGAEDTGDADTETSQGPGLELDAVPDPSLGLPAAQSWAAPAAAAGLARAWEVAPERAQASNLTDQQRWLIARALLRQASPGYDGSWTSEQGYGVYEQGATLPATPELQPPIDFTAEEVAPGRLQVSWTTWDVGGDVLTRITAADGSVLYEGTDTSFTLYHTREASLTLRAQTVRSGLSSAVGDSPRDLSPALYDAPRPTAERVSTQVTVRFPSIDGASTYTLQRRRPLGAWEEVASPQAASSWEDEPPSRLKPYEYRVVTDAPATDGSVSGTDPARGDTPWEAGLV